MPTLTKLTLPVKSGETITNVTYDLPSGGGGSGTVTSVATGAGLTGGPITGSGTIKAKLKSETLSSLEAADKGSSSGREYAVGLDANGNLSVNVPWSNSNTVPAAYCNTAADTAAKTATCTDYALLDKSYVHVLIKYANSSATALTLNINGKGAKAIYINGSASSTTNYTLPAGTYLVYYASSKYYFRTDGRLPASIVGSAASAESVTGTVPIENGGTGATTRLAAAKALTNENVGTSATYFLGMTSSWGKFGYVSLANAKTALGLGSAAYTDSTAYAAATHSHTMSEISDIGSIAGINTGSSTSTYLRNDGTWATPPNAIPSAYCSTAATTAAKEASCSGYNLLSKSYIQVIVTATNTAASALTLNINGKGAKPIYINGTATSSSNYGLTKGSYLVYYNGTNYYFRTDGKITGAGLVDIAGNTTKFLRGDGTWQVPSDTTYSVVSTTEDGLAPMVTDTSKFLKGDGTWATPTDTNTVPSAYCDTAAGTAAKTATCTGYTLTNKTYLHVIIKTANTAASALTLNVNGKGAKAIYINGTASSDTNYTLPAGSYIVYYNSSKYYFRTDGILPGTQRASVSGEKATFTTYY